MGRGSMPRIQPLHRAKDGRYSVVVVSFDESGQVSEICHCHNEGTTVHTCWRNWIAWLGGIAAARADLRTVYAHNGGSVDWLSLVEELLRERVPGVAWTAIPRDGSIIIVSILFGDTKCNLLDSSLMLGRCDLPALMGAVAGQMPEGPQEEATAMLAVVQRAEVACNSIAPIGALGATISTTALRIFRRMMGQKRMDGIAGPTCQELRARLRMSYKGGRTILRRPGYHPHVWVYDVNSMYPSVMRTEPVPMSGRFMRTRDPGKLVGIASVDWLTPTDTVPMFCDAGHGCYGRPEPAIQCTPEISDARRRWGWGAVGSHWSDVCLDSGILFKDYVDAVYQMRTESTCPVGRQIAKGLLVGLFGKFAERPERSMVMAAEPARVLECMQRVSRGLPADVYLWPDNPDLMVVEQTVQAEHEHVAISATITSAARVQFFKWLDLAERLGGLVYGDTDSIHTTVPLPAEHVGDGIGMLKVEVADCEGVYLAPKVYALREDDGSEKVIFKGLPVGKSIGGPITFSKLQEVWDSDNEWFNFEYQSSATADDVFSRKERTGRPVRRRRGLHIPRAKKDQEHED